MPSYGTIDSAVAATSFSCVIEPSEESQAASTRQRDSYAAQQQLLRTLTACTAAQLKTPAPGQISTSATVTTLSTTLWICSGFCTSADRWASAHDEAPMPLEPAQHPLQRRHRQEPCPRQTIAEILRR